MAKKVGKKTKIYEDQLEVVDIQSPEASITKEDLEDDSIIHEEEPKERKKGGKIGVLKSGLNLTEEAFCRAYISHDRDLYGNGVKCYLEVYGPEYFDTYKRHMSYKVAGVLANRLLKKVKIIDRINDLLEENGFNDQNVDKQHLFLINQHADLKTKLGAIKEYNSLKKRIDNNLNINNIVITPEIEQKVEDVLSSFIKSKNG